MEYIPPGYVDSDPQLKQLLVDFHSGEGNAKVLDAAKAHMLKNLKDDFQLALYQARIRRKLTQTELAEKLHMSQTAVSKIENGNHSLATIIKVADALGCRLVLSDIIGKSK
jgi:DNA-binding XRE family transcriptional regulator